jgi:hypothetical protein
MSYPNRGSIHIPLGAQSQTACPGIRIRGRRRLSVDAASTPPSVPPKKPVAPRAAKVYVHATIVSVSIVSRKERMQE